MEVQSDQSPQKELNRSEEEKSSFINFFSSVQRMEIQSDESPLKQLNRLEEEKSNSIKFFSSQQKMEIQSGQSPLKELNRSEEENNRSPIISDYKSPINPSCDQQDLKKADESLQNNTGTGTGTCGAEKKPAGNSSNVIISSNGSGTPERLKVPKAFKYPERYTSPTDHMISPISKGILARRRKVGALLPPSINQIN